MSSSDAFNTRGEWATLLSLISKWNFPVMRQYTSQYQVLGQGNTGSSSLSCSACQRRSVGTGLPNEMGHHQIQQGHSTSIFTLPFFWRPCKLQQGCSSSTLLCHFNGVASSSLLSLLMLAFKQKVKHYRFMFCRKFVSVKSNLREQNCYFWFTGLAAWKPRTTFCGTTFFHNNTLLNS